MSALAAGRHQDGGVEHPVLLGAGQFLPVHQQDVAVAGIDHLQFRHGTPLADLADGQAAAGQRLLEGDVVGPADCGQKSGTTASSLWTCISPSFRLSAMCLLRIVFIRASS